MTRNSKLRTRFPAYYRHDWMNERRKELGLSIRQVWLLSPVKEQSTRAVFRGVATSKQVFPIAKVLDMDWKMLHDLEPPTSEFRLAVLNGHSRSGR